ncbi:MAG: NUDIX hydrolase [Cytophagales bacterium]|jgi:8-oxo-dGTP pyrophosphatase MutT (NUDIX family)|nr:NUDIX hydrolase [Cytophagales bacterium]
MQNEQHNPWQTLSTEHKYDNPWIRVQENQVLNPGGGKGIYGVVHFKNKATGVVPVDEEGYTWLVGQYRYPLNEYSWEIPEGGAPLGTDPLAAAKRELKEETGLEADQWTLISRIHTSNSVCDEEGFVFLAQGLRHGESQPEETEALAVRRLPLREAVDMVMRNQITDGISIAGLLKAAILLGV